MLMGTLNGKNKMYYKALQRTTDSCLSTGRLFRRAGATAEFCRYVLDEDKHHTETPYINPWYLRCL